MVAGRAVPSASRIEISPSSANASSAVTMSPGFQTKPDARPRCECTETTAGAALATRPAAADENEARISLVGSVMGNSSRVDPNLWIGGRFGNWPDGQGAAFLELCGLSVVCTKTENGCSNVQADLKTSSGAGAVLLRGIFELRTARSSRHSARAAGVFARC